MSCHYLQNVNYFTKFSEICEKSRPHWTFVYEWQLAVVEKLLCSFRTVHEIPGTSLYLYQQWSPECYVRVFLFVFCVFWFCTVEKKKAFLALTHIRVHAQSCPNLCNPLDCSPSGSFVYGILQARILEWVAVSFSSFVCLWYFISYLRYLVLLKLTKTKLKK